MITPDTHSIDINTLCSLIESVYSVDEFWIERNPGYGLVMYVEAILEEEAQECAEDPDGCNDPECCGIAILMNDLAAKGHLSAGKWVIEL